MLIKQENNFLLPEELQALTSWDDMPLYLMTNGAAPEEGISDYIVPGLSHVMLRRWREFGTEPDINSGLYYVLKSIIERLCHKNNEEYTEILRASLNVTFPTKQKYIAEPHVDHEYPHNLVIIYLNDSSGSTVLFNKEVPVRYSPTAGSLIHITNAERYKHTAEPCKEGFRAVCVISYS